MDPKDKRSAAPRRQGQRFQASFQTRVISGEGDHICEVVNISAQGAMLRGCIEDGAGSLVSLEIPKIGMIRALVAWNDGETFGLSFELPKADMTKKVGPLKPQKDRRG